MADNLVYHYCNESVFKEIIQKKTLRFSDITKSNDSAELRWITTYFEPIFIEELNKANENSLFRTAYQNVDLVKFFQKFTDAFFVKALYGEEKFFWFYASCLSLEGDLLSQWRGYADDGKGFSIGFKREVFEQYSIGGFTFLNIRAGEVEYEKNKHVFSVEESIKKLFVDLNKVVEINDLCNESIRHIFRNCFQELIEKAVFIKNPFFREEKEWRMSVWTYKEFGDDDTILLVNNGVLEEYALNYREKDGKKIPYFDLNFVPEKVERIILGPKNKTNRAELDIFLKNNGFECDLKESDGTYI